MLLRQKVLALCDFRKWSIRALADEAGVSPNTLANAMNGHVLGVHAAIAVAAAMDVPVDWLFDDSKAGKDLRVRPFWAPPGINLGEALDAKAGLKEGLEAMVRRRHGSGASPRTRKQARQSHTDQPAAAQRKRRKSSA